MYENKKLIIPITFNIAYFISKKDNKMNFQLSLNRRFNKKLVNKNILFKPNNLDKFEMFRIIEAINKFFEDFAKTLDNAKDQREILLKISKVKVNMEEF